MSLGGGCMKPCIAAFGADQFDEEDIRENEMKKSFFNWWVFGISLGALVSATVLVYVQSYISWGWGFGTPTVLMGIYLVLYIVGLKFYRHNRPTGSPFTQIGQVIVAAVRNFRLRVPADPALLNEVVDKERLQAGTRLIPHSNTMRFLDKAAVLPNISEGSTIGIDDHSPWKLATVTEVEEVKLVLRLLPIWVAALIFQTPSAQISTFYTRQGNTLNVDLGSNFKIPAASLQSIIPLTIVCLIPIYDRIFVPIARHFTGNVRGISMLQRIGIGIIISLLSMVCAATTEIYRVKVNKTTTTTPSRNHSLFHLTLVTVFQGVLGNVTNPVAPGGAGSEGERPAGRTLPDPPTDRLHLAAAIHSAGRRGGVHLHRRAGVLLRPSAGLHAQPRHRHIPEHHRHR